MLLNVEGIFSSHKINRIYIAILFKLLFNVDFPTVITDAKETWTEWKGKGLPGHNKISVDNIATLEACKTLCIDKAWCKSIDYKKGGSKTCNLHEVDRKTVAIKSYANWDYYEVTRGESVTSLLYYK